MQARPFQAPALAGRDHPWSFAVIDPSSAVPYPWGAQSDPVIPRASGAGSAAPRAAELVAQLVCRDRCRRGGTRASRMTGTKSAETYHCVRPTSGCTADPPCEVSGCGTWHVEVQWRLLQLRNAVQQLRLGVVRQLSQPAAGAATARLWPSAPRTPTGRGQLTRSHHQASYERAGDRRP